ncbi:hypothetical protein FRB96_009708 [Tulasnella sp. 330]|nr:hypothetical protein FRB96_009708 [Tulasnella sp. 330]KAG8870440.1 hypothetical protein FRB98_001633 [Tulasnella sp. 332]
MTLSSGTENVALAMHKKRKIVVQRAGCANGLYLEPTASQTVNATAPFTIQWDGTCFTDSPVAVDIYMTAPYNTNTQIYTWLAVGNSGSYATTLNPSWWNSSSSITLQLAIVESGTPSFLTNLPAGPLFTAAYDGSKGTATSTAASGKSTHESAYQVVDNFFHGRGLTKGQIAAAVIMPLLIIGAAVAGYIRFTRQKEAKKRQRWSRAVDKRMSTISTDWKSMSGAAASHAIRHSMVGGGDRSTRASSFFAGNGPLPNAIGGARPSSTFSDAGQAGVGVRYNNGLGIGGNTEAMDSTDDMAAVLRRPAKEGAVNPAARVSRVSFAADVHPRNSTAGDSMQTRTSIYTQGTGARGSRAYHHSFYAPDDGSVPPLPDIKFRDNMEVTPPGSATSPAPGGMSPTQAIGPEPLTPQEIRTKIAAATAEYEGSRPSVDEGLLRMPAMSMMRTSDASSDVFITVDNSQSMLSPTTPIDYPALAPVSPAAAYSAHGPSAAPARASATYNPNTFGGLTPMHEESQMMSPDAMLKAYAIQKAASGTVSPPPRAPSVTGFTVKRRQTSNEKVQTQAQTTSSANGGMRVLYAPSSNTTANVPTTVVESVYDEESIVQPSNNGYTDSMVASTEEGVVTYGHRSMVLSGPTLLSTTSTGASALAGGLGPAGSAPEDRNPFRITSSYSDVSRYSGLDDPSEKH